MYRPKHSLCTVEKNVKYVKFPFMGNFSQDLHKKFNSILLKYIPSHEFRFVFVNNMKMCNLFNFKDKLCPLMRSLVVYKLTCPRFILGTYFGCTKRLLKVRIDEHRGVSYRTQNSLKNPPYSSIRDHTNKCKYHPVYSYFSIIAQSNNEFDLNILESILIKQVHPTLNKDQTSSPLFIV